MSLLSSNPLGISKKGAFHGPWPEAAPRVSLAPNLRVRITYVRPPERRSASDAMSTSKDKYNPVHAQMQMPLPMLV